MNTNTDMFVPSIDEEAIFKVACRIPAADVRADYLRQVCGDDLTLMTRLEQLLSTYFEAPDFLESSDSAAESSFDFETVPDLVDTAVGPYNVRERLGEGGMGVVYVAEQTKPLRRKVALKVIKPGMATKDVVARFNAERQALALMDHPNIARVIDGGTTDAGQPFFVMELVQGEPITQYCDAHRLTTRQRLQLLIKVCRAVQHAHQKGVIHRDLKPSNVLVADIDGEAIPKVIDFGVARAVNRDRSDQTVYTKFSQMIGTPLYMSPEQTTLGVVDVDTRSDVYSLGVLLYELLTGGTPFTAETLKDAGFDEMRRIIREDEPLRPSEQLSTLKAESISTLAQQRRIGPRQLVDGMRSELDWIVLRALDKNRNRRYESPNALAEDLDRYLHGEPVDARQPSVGYRLRKFFQRHGLALAIAASILLALSIGLATALWQANLATASARQASEHAERAERLAAEQQQAHARAHESLAMAISTVDEMYDGLASLWLASDAGLSDLQQRYFRKAVAFYDRLLDEPDAYELDDHQIATMSWRSARMLHKLYDDEAALRRIRPAVDRFAASLSTDADLGSASDSSLMQLADMQNLLGVLAERNHQLDEAVERFSAANATCELLISRPSKETEARATQAQVANNLHQVYWRQGRLEMAEASMREAIRMLSQIDAEVRTSRGYRVHEFAFQGNLSAIVLAEGDSAEAETIASSALQKTRFALLDTPDDRGLREAELQLMESLSQSLVAQQRFVDAEPLLGETLDRQVAFLSTGVEPPVYLFSQFIGQLDRFRGGEEPEKWSNWIRNTLRLARVEFELGWPIAAESRLSRADIAAGFVAKVYPDDPRHQVDLANLHAITARVLRSRRDDESAQYAALAAKAWQEALTRFPTLETANTGVFWPQEDYEWFLDQFPEWDVRVSDVAHRAEEAQRIERALAARGQAMIMLEFGHPEGALQVVRPLLESRQPVAPVDLLLATEVLNEVGRVDEAKQRFQEAQELLTRDEQIEPFVAQWRDKVEQLLREELDGSDTEDN